MFTICAFALHLIQSASLSFLGLNWDKFFEICALLMNFNCDPTTTWNRIDDIIQLLAWLERERTCLSMCAQLHSSHSFPADGTLYPLRLMQHRKQFLFVGWILIVYINSKRGAYFTTSHCFLTSCVTCSLIGDTRCWKQWQFIQSSRFVPKWVSNHSLVIRQKPAIKRFTYHLGTKACSELFGVKSVPSVRVILTA